VANERKFWEILAEGQHDKLVLSWLSVVLTVLVIALSGFLVAMAVRPKPVVVVPGAAMAGVYSAGEMPETVMVQFARISSWISPISLRPQQRKDISRQPAS
jgi:hypothetical protein